MKRWRKFWQKLLKRPEIWFQRCVCRLDLICLGKEAAGKDCYHHVPFLCPVCSVMIAGKGDGRCVCDKRECAGGTGHPARSCDNSLSHELATLWPCTHGDWELWGSHWYPGKSCIFIKIHTYFHHHLYRT